MKKRRSTLHSSRHFLVQTACFVSIQNGALLRQLAPPEVLLQVRARRLRVHEVVRSVAGAHPLPKPDHPRRPGCGRAQVGGCPRPRPAARVLTRFSTASWPDLSRRRGESFVGVSVHHSFGCVSFLLCKATPLRVSFFFWRATPFVERRHCLCVCWCLTSQSPSQDDDGGYLP